jgi:hypothetical protein
MTALESGAYFYAKASIVKGLIKSLDHYSLEDFKAIL